jgi:hypothetical protein
VSAKVLPNEVFIYPLIKEICPPSIAIPFDPTIGCTQDISINIVHKVRYITTMCRKEIDDMIIVFIAPNGQGRITNRLIFELFDQLIDPCGITRLGDM